MKSVTFILFLLFYSLLFGQTTLYYEPFTGQIGKGIVGAVPPASPTTDVAGITTWTITPDNTGLVATTDWFQVVDDGTGNAVFEGRDVDAIQTWQSSVVNVTGYSNLTITVDLTQTGGLDASDYMSVYYILDGGPLTLIGTYNGAFANPTTVTQTGISGTNLQVVIKVLDNAGTEKYRFDNVKIVGDNSATTDITNLSNTPGNTSGSFSWTAPTGCSDEIMVVASTASITAIPSGDGTTYTANSVYGSGTNISGAEYVVYKGNSTGFTVTGLTNETQYCIKVFNRCGTVWSSGVETCFYPWDYRDTLVIMAYNVLNYPGSTSARWANFRTIVKYVQPDIILCNEMISDAGANLLLNNALNSYGVNYYAKATFVDGPDSDNIMFYNTNKVNLATQNQIATALRDISHYQVSWLNVNGGTSTLDLYSLHLKASSGATNENKRLIECQNLRTHMDGSLPVQSNIIVGGDFNFYGAGTEPAWNELTNNGVQRLNDPINRVGNWHDNSTFSDVHTQATRSSANPGGSGGATGGVDDRFDFLLANNYVINGGAGFSSRTIDYFQVDPSPFEGINYYRLIQVDFNGEHHLIKTIAVHFIPELIDLLLYPNPTNGNIVNIHCENIYERFVTIEFKNMLGQIVYDIQFETPSKNFTLPVELPNYLTDDVYIVSVITNNRQVNKKLIIKR
jgi:hypothetical protein